MTSIDHLMKLAAAYCDATGLQETTLSTRLFQDGKRLGGLRNGSDMGVRRLDRALQWLSANWPEGAEWPAEITRPAPVPAPSLEAAS